MYDGNPVHIHTGRYPRGIDVSNFKWQFEYFVPDESFLEVGYKFGSHLFLTFIYFSGFVWTQISTKRRYAKILNTNMFNTRVYGEKIYYTYLRGKINLVKFNFVGGKGGHPGKGGPDVECLWFELHFTQIRYPLPFSEAQSNRRSGAIIRLGFAVGNASYSVGFPSAQIPADMMFSRTWLGKC